MVNAEPWSLNISSTNVDGNIGGDNITMGMCEGCSDGLQYGSEDLVDLTASLMDFTNIYFFNPEWLGIPDTNGNTTDTPFFATDFKSLHESEDLLIWKISGNCAEDVSTGSFYLNWSVDSLETDYDIYLYIQDDPSSPINMRYSTFKQINCNMLLTDNDIINGEIIYNSRIKILMGGCAGTPMYTYYEDLDGDGWGSDMPSEFCYGYEEEGWVDNSEDMDDEIHCVSNDIDSCDVCNGQNQDLDCNDVCFGDDEQDMCGTCDNNPDNDCAQDCAGDWGGDAQLDCNNDCNGEAQLDECGICSEGNSNHEAESDMDCNDECFGDAVIDYCGDCDGFNAGCPELVFGNGPIDLYAQIDLDMNQIDLTWLYPDINISNQIIGYNIYQQIEDEYNLLYIFNSIDFLSYSISGYNSGTFCITAYDVFENETNYICAEASEFNNYTFTLMDGANLVSFPYLSNSDATVINIFNSIEGYIQGVIAEGAAASFTYDQGWVGNINEMKRRKGYWLKIDVGSGEEVMDCDGQECIYFSVAGIETDHGISYTLHEGANLISYVGPNGVAVGDAIPDDVEHLFDGIIGEGQAATQNPTTGWVGNLTHFNIGEGYWIKITPNTPDFNFIWNSDNPN